VYGQRPLPAVVAITSSGLGSSETAQESGRGYAPGHDSR